MKVYLVRHGDALSEAEDPRRSLSPAGRAQVSKVAGVLARMRVRVGRIECSTKQRALDTAEIIAAAIDGKDRLVPREGLAPNDAIERVLKELRAAGEDRMLVGHLPYMGYMASALLGGSSSGLRFSISPATVLCLSSGTGRSFTLDWMLRPELLE